MPLPAVNSFRASLGASSNPNPTPNNYAPDPTASISVNENYIYSRYLSGSALFFGSLLRLSSRVSLISTDLGRPASRSFLLSPHPMGMTWLSDIPYDSFGVRCSRGFRSDEHAKRKYTIRGSGCCPESLQESWRVYRSFGLWGKTLENSPLDRVLAQAAPGSDWDGKKYSISISNQCWWWSSTVIPRVPLWSNNATVSVLGLSGTYGASSLYKNVVTDEDGNSTIEFKNGQGQIVLGA